MQLINSLKRFSATYSAKLGSWNWPDYSRVFVVTDHAGWSLDWDARELKEIFQQCGVSVRSNADSRRFSRQCVFYTSRSFLMNGEWLKNEHRVATPYYHGKPGTGFREFDQIWAALQKHHDKISRLQTTNTEMHRLILETGIDPGKVFRIPIGINLEYFPVRALSDRDNARRTLEIPQTAFVVGSFQKDGNGWGEGYEPKLVKGPDIFVEAMRILKQMIPELLVLLSGPARGYVKKGLEKNNIPFRHVFLHHYPDIARLYRALDVYLVSSRQEGGPKAILESMATGVPLVTTRVGQAIDLVDHGINGWMTDINDPDALAYWVSQVHESPELVETVISCARKTAVDNRYEAQHTLWMDFLAGFVESNSG
jgi:glycosyltransferase involved in cell wall biosynthesis